MKKVLILVKHSLPEITEALPANQWTLTKEGQARAHQLAERLSRYKPQVVVSSPEPKAKETAEVIARKYQLDVQVVDDLHEHDRSNEPYCSIDDFRALVRQFFQKPDELVFGRETANQAYARFQRAVNSVLHIHADTTIVIVAHGTVISLFVSHLTGISNWLLWNELGLPSFVVMDLQSKTLVAKENIV